MEINYAHIERIDSPELFEKVKVFKIDPKLLLEYS